MPAMVGDLATDLCQLLAQFGQRPGLDLFRPRLRPHEIGEVVGRRALLEPDLVGTETVIK